MIFFKRNRYILLWWIASCGVVSAQTSANETLTDSIRKYDLKEVVITATRTLRQLASLPLQVQLVKEKELRRINSSRLSDVLAEQTGLVTVPGHTGGEGIQMQGLDVAYTLILVDEMPLVGRTIGQLDLNRISVGNIRQIEIVKGASSSLYGSEALGGVINIITQQPDDGWNTSANYRFSSFDTHDASATVGYKKNKLALSTFFNRYSSDGYNLSDTDVPTVSPYANITLRNKLSYRFSERTDGSISLRYFSQNQDYILSNTAQGESQIREWNAHAKLNNKYSERWSSFFELYATRYKTHEYVDGNLTLNQDENSDFNQTLVRPEIRGMYSHNEQSDFVFGVGANFDKVEKTIFISDSRMQSYYLYGQWDVHFLEKINMIAGFRYDFHSEYRSQFSPKLAFRYEISPKTALKASVGYGYKAPDFRQLYNHFSNSAVGYTVLGYNAVSSVLQQMLANGEIAGLMANPADFANSGLLPESSVSFNLGMDFKPIPKLKFGFNLFRNDIKNLIDTQIIATKNSGQSVYSYYNAQKVFTQGIEINATYYATPQFEISGGYQLLYAKDKEVAENFKKRNVYARDANGTIFQLSKNDYFGLINRSRHSANLKLYYSIPKWKTNANLRAVYRSKYALGDTNNNAVIDRYDRFVSGYVLCHFAVNKQIGEHFTAGIGANNLLDYTDPQYISNLPGRIAYINLSINF
ncbi:MAG: TonB-dependent receptor [Capnocytophaga sp.]|nr:TonB-dependent receptor [Capnocytophaga sp.]